METFDAFGSEVVKDEDGLTVNHQSGAKIKMNNDGSCSVKTDSIKSFGIKHLPDVKTYEKTTSDGVITHRIEFYKDDSYFILSYKEDGKLIEASGNNITSSISRDGEFLIGMGESIKESEEVI
ncbi:hypothetical protein [Kistimonas asteriae]|uniref:hypothetical protein n=1 Tax=Kistimonas asteriae TaxID=517724 RepID=UPI001BA6BBA9|nr:hypothetical protein [Kistimonas asteriae]